MMSTREEKERERAEWDNVEEVDRGQIMQNFESQSKDSELSLVLL